MAGLTQPLEFRKFMTSQPTAGFDFVPFLDGVLIFLFAALNISAFVLSPGTTIDLPSSPPVLISQANPTAVLTVDRNQLYFFEGLKLAESGLEEKLKAFVDEHLQDPEMQQATLLIKADASIQTEVLFKLMDSAYRAGFTRIHLAAEPQSGETVSPLLEGSR